ncbi:sulfotransferase domain-containing protein [Maritimibacter sp. DP1N21-5]|uniref:sulfotransferase domain-containing protein n=1 Tax=Maritimibacter sp. DP1N21-5 TaxID=2836867 RepID=UPI001C486258|nr:sulfotransferase domain-containing protein [Maritimibacter sp. DP1N21-5]MBV7409446.1 sulfotransferase [Maritimibacter sp. DP1N21-5]
MIPQTLIYCVGAAKAGTSWLFDYLFGHPECYFPTVKELHYWDGIRAGHGGMFRDQLPGRIADIRARHEVTQDERQRAYQERNMADLTAWHDRFDGVTRDDAMYRDFIGIGSRDARVVGDFTPAYATMPKPWMAEMVAVHDDVKAIYLLREPVDRLWSHFRMDAGAGGEVAARAKMDDFLSGGEEIVAQRSNYRQAINRLTEVLPRERVLVEFYERLFSQATLDRICDFIGIARREGAVDKQVHGSAPASLDAERRARAQVALKQQYNFIERFMGGLPAEWTSKMVTA